MTPTRREFLRTLGSGAAFLGTASWAPQRLFAEPPTTRFRLPHSTPEAQGVSSAGIATFLEEIAKEKHELHSFVMVRHGHVVAEGWWAPYAANLKHTMYSMSKSFTSTAIGLAVAEGKLTVEDPVTSFFPKDLPEKVSDLLAKLKVKHLLTMSVGNEKEPTYDMVQKENWVQAFLAAPITHEPGSVFMYNSGATYMLSAIVQHLTGQKVIDYLTPRLFKPLGIEGVTWETCPRGINAGGWGLSVQTESLAKFGQLYLQKGQWQGREILPAKWVEEATTFKIQQPDPAKPTRLKEQNDWLQGYCYQFWRCQHQGFRGDGAFGQYTIVLPELDAVIAMTSENSNMQGQLDLVWEHLLPAMKQGALEEDAAMVASLRKNLKSLKLPTLEGKPETPTDRIANKTFQLEPNSLGLESMTFSFSYNRCLLRAVDSKKATHGIDCMAPGEWCFGKTAFPGTPPRLISGGAPPPGTQFKYAASFAMKDENTLEMLWRYIETPHHDTVTCAFDGDQVKITFLSSIAAMKHQKDARPVLVGKV